jgi:hypothetical protein
MNLKAQNHEFHTTNITNGNASGGALALTQASRSRIEFKLLSRRITQDK